MSVIHKTPPQISLKQVRSLIIKELVFVFHNSAIYTYLCYGLWSSQNAEKDNHPSYEKEYGISADNITNGTNTFIVRETQNKTTERDNSLHWRGHAITIKPV